MLYSCCLTGTIKETQTPALKVAGNLVAINVPAGRVLEVEEHVAAQHEPAAVVGRVPAALLVQEARVVGRGVAGGVEGQAALVQLHGAHTGPVVPPPGQRLFMRPPPRMTSHNAGCHSTHHHPQPPPPPFHR